METNCCLCVCLRPRTSKQLVNGLFPNNFSGEQTGVRPVNVKRLVTYATRFPRKLPLIARFLDARIRADLGRRRLGAVLLALEALRALVRGVRETLQSLEVIQDRVLLLLLALLKHESPVLRAAATHAFAGFAATAEDLHACTVSPHFAAVMAELLALAARSAPHRARFAALRALRQVVLVADAHTVERYLPALVPNVLDYAGDLAARAGAAAGAGGSSGPAGEEKKEEDDEEEQGGGGGKAVYDGNGELDVAYTPVAASDTSRAARSCLLTLARRVRPLALGELLRPIFEAFDSCDWAPVESVVQLTRAVALAAANPAAVPVFLFLLRRVADSSAPPSPATSSAAVTPAAPAPDAQRDLQRKARVLTVAERLLAACPAAVSVASWQHETMHVTLREVLLAAEAEALCPREPQAPVRRLRAEVCAAAAALVGTFVRALRSPLDRTEALTLVTEIAQPALAINPDGDDCAPAATPARRRRRSEGAAAARRAALARRWYLEAVLAAATPALGPPDLHDRLFACVLHLCADADAGVSLLALRALASLTSVARPAPAVDSSSSTDEDSSDGEGEGEGEEEEEKAPAKQQQQQQQQQPRVELSERESLALHAVAFRAALRCESAHHAVAVVRVLGGQLGADPVAAIADGLPLAMAMHEEARQTDAAAAELFCITAGYLLRVADAVGCEALGQYVTEVLVERQVTGLLPAALLLGPSGLSTTALAPAPPAMPGDLVAAEPAAAAAASPATPAAPAAGAPATPAETPKSLASTLMSTFHVHATAKSRRAMWLDPQQMRRCLASLASLRDAFPEGRGGLAQIVAARAPLEVPSALRALAGALDQGALASTPMLTELDAAAGASDDEDEEMAAVSPAAPPRLGLGFLPTQNSMLGEDESPPPSPAPSADEVAQASFSSVVAGAYGHAGRMSASLDALCDASPHLPADVELTNVKLHVDHAGPGSPLRKL